MIRRIKNKKGSGRLGWKAEWIKERGEEKVNSFCILFHRIKTENQILMQWGFEVSGTLDLTGSSPKLFSFEF